MKIENLILGRRVKADHPITVLNPEESFIVTEVKLEVGGHFHGPSFYVKGENTMWFHESLVELVDRPSRLEEEKRGRLIRI